MPDRRNAVALLGTCPVMSDLGRHAPRSETRSSRFSIHPVDPGDSDCRGPWRGHPRHHQGMPTAPHLSGTQRTRRREPPNLCNCYTRVATTELSSRRIQIRNASTGCHRVPKRAMPTARRITMQLSRFRCTQFVCLAAVDAPLRGMNAYCAASPLLQSVPQSGVAGRYLRRISAPADPSIGGVATNATVPIDYDLVPSRPRSPSTARSSPISSERAKRSRRRPGVVDGLHSGTPRLRPEPNTSDEKATPGVTLNCHRAARTVARRSPRYVDSTHPPQNACSAARSRQVLLARSVNSSASTRSANTLPACPGDLSAGHSMSISVPGVRFILWACLHQRFGLTVRMRASREFTSHKRIRGTAASAHGQGPGRAPVSGFSKVCASTQLASWGRRDYLMQKTRVSSARRTPVAAYLLNNRIRWRKRTCQHPMCRRRDTMAGRGRPKKGDRTSGYTVRLPTGIGDPDALAKKMGFTSVSQWLADLACVSAGTPELALELNQQHLCELNKVTTAARRKTATRRRAAPKQAALELDQEVLKAVS